MKDRTNDFKDYAWELARQHNCSSEAKAIEAAMRKGYEMAIKDVNEDFGQMLEGLKADRTEGNKPK